MKKRKTNVNIPQVKSGEQIEIIKRFCSDNIQKGIIIGQRFVVEEVSKLKNGTIVLIVKNPARSKSTLRINAERFAWRIVKVEELKREAAQKQAVQKINETKQILQDNFSEDEQKQILFVSAAILEVTAYISEGVLDLCRGDKELNIEPITEYKKLSRELRSKLDSFRHSRQCSLGRFSDNLKKIMYDFMDNNGGDLLNCLMGTVQKKFHEIDSDISPRLLRVKIYAATGWLMIEMLKEHENHVDEIITRAFGGCAPHNISKDILRIGGIMKEYCEVKDLSILLDDSSKDNFNNLLDAIGEIHFDFNGYPEY